MSGVSRPGMPVRIAGKLVRSVRRPHGPSGSGSNPLLTDEEIAAQSDFIAECRRPHPKPTKRQVSKQVMAERFDSPYPVEWEKLPPDEFERRRRKWEQG